MNTVANAARQVPLDVPEQWARAVPDSRVLERPRLLARRLLPLDRLDLGIASAEQLQATATDLRMPIPDFGGLELAAVKDLLLIASKRPFTAVQRRTRYSLIVADLTESIEQAVALGAEVTEPPEAIVPGARARLRLPDAHLIELVEHRPLPDEVAGAPATAAPAQARRDTRTAAPTTRLFAQTLVDRARFDDICALYSTLLGQQCSPQDVRSSGQQVRVASVGAVLVVARQPGRDASDEIPLAAVTTSAAELRRFAATCGLGSDALRSTAIWERDGLGEPAPAP